VAGIARALNVTDVVDLPDPARARAAAFIITAAEGGHHHLSDLRSQPGKFDPNTRTRLIAGALAPSAWVLYAQRFRSWYRLEMAKIFARVDVIIAPSTPCPAVHIGQKTIRWHGAEVPARANLGVFTQPVSFVGLPVLNVPVARPDKLPIGVQLIAAPYNEAALFRVAGLLEANRAVSAPVASI
jgi:Asp-tRNA(Asn)/Glu-tRNA(Gln) amidotransferase A subunit family amidase